jgi:cytochrome b561
MKLAAHLSHLAFYLLMIALPLLGWSMLSAGGYPVVVAGVRLPAIAPHSDALHTLFWNSHKLLALLFFFLIVAHIAAALLHALIRRDGVFEAMAPWGDTVAGMPVDNGLVAGKTSSRN